MKLIKQTFYSALLVGFTSLANAEDVTIHTARGEVSLATNPQKVAVYDISALDDLTAIGIEVGATVDNVALAHLKETYKDATVIGTFFEPNLEALNAYQPDLVIVGSRSAAKYDDVKAVAPNTIDVTIDFKQFIAQSLLRIEDYGKLFGKEAEATKVTADINQLIEDTKAVTKDKGKALTVLVSGNRMSAYGSGSRFGWIYELGIAEASEGLKEGIHGQPISHEFIKEVNPDWLIVLDRGAAIGRNDGGASAQEFLDNAVVGETTAWKKGQVIYLSGSAYIAPGSVHQLSEDINRVKTAFAKAQ